MTQAWSSSGLQTGTTAIPGRPFELKYGDVAGEKKERGVPLVGRKGIGKISVYRARNEERCLCLQKDSNLTGWGKAGYQGTEKKMEKEAAQLGGVKMRGKRRQVEVCRL